MKNGEKTRKTEIVNYISKFMKNVVDKGIPL